jgi:hypothetical protein
MPLLANPPWSLIMFEVINRLVVFGLASLSFACLLGHFYGLWTMHFFACWVLPPATLLLAIIAWRGRNTTRSVDSPYVWIVHGAIGGLIAAIAYDLYRVPFVLNGAPLFKVFEQFGRWILNSNHPGWLVQLAGWSYHFSNGAALGIMFLAMVIRPSRRNLVVGAIFWALFVEGMLLLTPYAAALGLQMNRQFIFLTVSAHLIFGITLGLWLQHRYQRSRLLEATPAEPNTA